MSYPLPSLNALCSIIQIEETRRKVMTEESGNRKVSGEEEKTEKMAFLVRGATERNQTENSDHQSNALNRGRGRPFCTYCKKQGHSRERC
ncbi:unnamed protein product [Victoria cruziana]